MNIEQAADTPLDGVEWVPTAAGTLRVRRFGSRPADIILWSGLFFDDRQHEPLAEALVARGFSVALISPPGFAGSGEPPQGLTMEQCGEALVAVARRCGAARPSIGGTSWGGIAALHAALQQPGFAATLLLFNTPIGGGSKAGMMRWIPALTRLPPGLFARGAAPSLLGRTSRRRLQGVIVEAMRQAHSLAAVRMAKLVLQERPDVSQRLRELRMPALVILGPEDALYPLAASHAGWHGVGGAYVHEIAGTGHSSALEQPTQVADAVDRFVRAHGAALFDAGPSA